MHTHSSAVPLLNKLAIATVLAATLLAPAWAADKDIASNQKKTTAKPALATRAAVAAELRAQDPNKDSAKDDAGGKKDVNKEVPGGGPSPNIPGLTREDPRGAKTGGSGSGSTDPLQAVKEAGTIRDGTSNTLLINEAANGAAQRPRFDNGFGETPQPDEKAVSDAMAGHSGNPMKGLVGNDRVGGPLGDSAAASDASRGHGIGKDAVAEGITSPTGMFKDGELKNRGKGNLAKDLGIDDRKATGLVMGGKRFEEIDAISRGENPDAGKPAEETKPAKADKLICHNDDCSHSATVHPDGSVDVRKPDKTRETIQPDGSSVTRDKDGKVIDEQEAYTGRPDPDGNHGTISKQDFLQQKLGDRNFLIKESAKAGGTVNPDRGETSSGVSRSGAVPSQQSLGRNLVGQPGSQNVRSGGSASGPNFNGNLGAIDPGPDQTVSGGAAREQDHVGETLGRVGTRTNLNGRPSSDEDDDDTTESDKDK